MKEEVRQYRETKDNESTWTVSNVLTVERGRGAGNVIKAL
jgi:hypothetical protein